MEIARDPLAVRNEVQLLDVASSARERERCRGLHAERLQEVDLVGLQVLASTGCQHAEHCERLAGRVQRDEETGCHSGVGQHRGHAGVGPQVGDELGLARFSPRW